MLYCISLLILALHHNDSALHTFWQYILYLLRAKDAHGLHSPFVFELYNDIIASDKWYYAFDTIEDYRDSLLTDTTKIQVTDLGAGSKRLHQPEKLVSDIARYSVSQPYVCQLLFKLVDYLQPQTLVELGTSLGINTLYMATPLPTTAHLYTLEGCPAISNIAQKTFDILPTAQKQIHLLQGNINDTLPALLKTMPTLDMVFFDANHAAEPTLQYFDWCLAKAGTHSLFVFDDIYWSKEMTKAWQQICQHPKATVTIDLFQVGLVFFRTEQPKQHFTLKFA
jgi:predicted O-methyltransferase YrrM